MSVLQQRTAPEATVSYPPAAAVVSAVPVPRQSSPAAATNA
jgi:hypothetical protein